MKNKKDPADKKTEEFNEVLHRLTELNKARRKALKKMMEGIQQGSDSENENRNKKETLANENDRNE